jgi:integrase/recombinase XerD
MEWREALNAFARYQRAGNLSEKTITNREESLLLLARIAECGPLQVTEDHMLQALSRAHPRTGRPLAAGTKQSERSYYQTFFTWLHAKGHRPDNPAGGLPKVKQPRRKPRPLRLTQVDAMLDSGAYKRTRDIITICALSGLRIGEVVKIRGEDVDLEGGVLRSVRKGSLQHVIALNSALIHLAHEYPREGWWFPSPYKNREFPDGGGHVLMKSASDRVSRAIRNAGITDPNLTAHSLRHFYATTLLKQGVNIRVVQELLGHASLATTQLYTEVDQDDMRAGVAVLPLIAHRSQSARRRGARESGSMAA